MPKETVKILKARYEEREIVSFDHLRLHGYLCVQSEPNSEGLYVRPFIEICQ